MFLEKRSVQLLFIVACLVPLIALSISAGLLIYQSSTRAILARRESLGRSVARLASERFDSFIELGIHYTSHATFQKLIREKKWDQAMGFLVAEQQPIPAVIERMVLFEKNSIAWVDWPHVSGFDAIKGKATPTRDWYIAVSRDWEPIVTDAFTRLTEPKINVVSVVIPIKSTKKEDYGMVLGILNLSITLDKFTEWSKTLTNDEGTKIHFIDQQGHMIGHPSLTMPGDLVDYSSVPAVQKLLAGQEGVEELYNPVEGQKEVAAYFSMKPYNWGVLVAQESSVAFRERTHQLRQISVFVLIIWSVSIVLFIILYKAFFLIHKYRSQDQVLLDSIGDGVFATDVRFTIVLWNKAASAITGLSAQEVIGRSCCDVFKFIDRRTRRDKSVIIQEAIRKGEIRHLAADTVMVIHDGREIPISDSAAPILGTRGKVEGAIVVFQDKTAERDLNASKDEFLSIAAHQLRTPLGILRWRIEQLGKANGKKDLTGMSKKLSDMHISTLFLIKLVNDLLDVSRINQKRIIHKSSVVDVGELIEKVLSEEHEEIVNKKLRVKIELIKRTKKTVVTDPNLLVQILRNLLCNAIDYNRSGGSLFVRLTKVGDSLGIAIEDTGIGIPEGYRERIFEKFTRAPNAVKSGVAGSGLGMFVVQSYVKVLGGTIAVKSEENIGTTVTITIPYENHTHHRG